MAEALGSNLTRVISSPSPALWYTWSPVANSIMVGRTEPKTSPPKVLFPEHHCFPCCLKAFWETYSHSWLSVWPNLLPHCEWPFSGVGEFAKWITYLTLHRLKYHILAGSKGQAQQSTPMGKPIYDIPTGTLLGNLSPPRTLATLSRPSAACVLWNVHNFHKGPRSQYLSGCRCRKWELK